MNNFYIITNPHKDPELEYTNFVKNYLEEKGKICYVQKEILLPAEKGYKYTDADLIPENVDCVLVLGGDGTLLQASRDLLDTGLPLLGINLGTLGYLAEIDSHGIRLALDRLIKGDFSIEERMMLSGAVYENGRLLMSDIALNDIVITRTGRLRVMDYDLYVDDVFLCSSRADGIIVSTPTGSTGYSLSAGGPIVAPGASLIQLTFLAAHTISTRPVILPDNVKVAIEAKRGIFDAVNGAGVTFDGDSFLSLNSKSRIIVEKAAKKTRLIKINNTSFLEILREKLK